MPCAICSTRARRSASHHSRANHALRGGRVTRRGPGGWVRRPPPTSYRSPGEPFPLWGRCVVVSRGGKGSADPSPRPPPRHPPGHRCTREQCALLRRVQPNPTELIPSSRRVTPPLPAGSVRESCALARPGVHARYRDCGVGEAKERDVHGGVGDARRLERLDAHAAEPGHEYAAAVELQARFLERPHRGLRLGLTCGRRQASASPSSKMRRAILGSRGPVVVIARIHSDGCQRDRGDRAVTRVADAHVEIRAPRAVDVHLGRAGRGGQNLHPPGREREGLEAAPPWPRRAPPSTRLDAAARPAGPPARPRAGRDRASLATPSAREPGASSPAHPVPGPRRRGFVRASRGLGHAAGLTRASCGAASGRGSTSPGRTRRCTCRGSARSSSTPSRRFSSPGRRIRRP